LKGFGTSTFYTIRHKKKTATVLVDEGGGFVLVSGFVQGGSFTRIVAASITPTTSQVTSPSASLEILQFGPTSSSEIFKILFNCFNRQCDSDPIPT